jgi:hypothetical protein
MPTQTLIATEPIAGPYPTLPVAATSLDLTWTAADTVNGNYFILDKIVNFGSAGGGGGDVLLVWNTDTSAHNLTLKSQPDQAGRSGDITTYSVGAGVVSAFDYSQLSGWADSSGFVYISADNATVKFAILQK